MNSKPYRYLLLASALLAITAPPSRGSANNCATGGTLYPGGIGGTGVQSDHPDEGGIGGTAARPAAPTDEGGIGGTAAVPAAPTDEGGIGGTGISAQGDTGVIGTITGFASICVGSREIHYAPNTPIRIDGHPANIAQLGVGQVVEVVANGKGDEIAAVEISLQHIVSGPITRIDPETNRIEVLGQTVQLSTATASTTASDTTAAAGGFSVGTSVNVSGMRRTDGVIVATRVALSRSGDVVRLSGPLSTSPSGTLSVAGVPLQTTPTQQFSNGDEVRVEGNWDGTTIIARSLRAIPRVPFSGRVGEVDLEGYTTGSVESGQLRIGPFDVTVPKSARAGLAGSDTRVRLHAIVRDRQIVAERISVVGDFRPASPPPPPEHGKAPAAGKPDLDDPRGDSDHAPPGPQDWNVKHERDGAQPPRPDSPQRPATDRPPNIEHGAPPPRPDRPQPPPRPDRPDPLDRPQRPDRGDRPPAPPDRPERPPPVPEIPEHHGRR